MPDGKLTAPVISAAIAVIGKVVVDIRAQHRERQAVAAALKGEISAYVRLIRPPEFIAGLRAIAAKPPDERKDWLKAFPALPTTHPVFDKLADKIGLISPEAAQGVSEVYNVVTGLRIHISHLPSEAFLETTPNFRPRDWTTLRRSLAKRSRVYPRQSTGLMQHRARASGAFCSVARLF